MRSLRTVWAMSFVLLGAALPSNVGGQAPPAGRASAAPGESAPVTLRATCDAKGASPVLRVQLVNRSDRPTSLVVGFTVKGAGTQVVNSVNVMAIRPATGAEEAYLYVNPTYAQATGAPWVVSLAPGASHALDLPLWDFISTSSFTSLDAAVASTSRLVFEARPAAQGATPVWTGKVDTAIEACQ